MSRAIEKLLAVLLVIMLSAIPQNSVKAETVDDLRVLIGNHRVNSEETRAEIRAMLNVYEQAELRNKLSDLLSSIEEKVEAERNEKLIKLESEKATKEQELLTLMSNDNDVNEVLSVVRELESLVVQIAKQENSALNIDIQVDTTKFNDYEADYEYAQSLLESIENDYEIGDIGWDLNPPTSGIFILADAFGTYLDADTNTKEVQNNGVRFLALKYEDTPVLSQWHGTVESVNGGKIVVKHGNSLQTIYDGVEDIKVKSGDTVKQYDVLGKVKGESLYFEIVLDTKYIDPMRVYGVEGTKAYYNWVNANPSRILTLNDMSNVKNDIVGLEKSTNESVIKNTEEPKNNDDVIEATLPEDYEAPNPGVLQ